MGLTDSHISLDNELLCALSGARKLTMSDFLSQFSLWFALVRVKTGLSSQRSRFSHFYSHQLSAIEPTATTVATTTIRELSRTLQYYINKIVDPFVWSHEWFIHNSHDFPANKSCSNASDVCSTLFLFRTPPPPSSKLSGSKKNDENWEFPSAPRKQQKKSSQANYTEKKLYKVCGEEEIRTL